MKFLTYLDPWAWTLSGILIFGGTDRFDHDWLQYTCNCAIFTCSASVTTIGWALYWGRRPTEPGINSNKRTRYTPKSEIFWILRWCVLSFCTCWAKKKLQAKVYSKNIFLVFHRWPDSFACQPIFIARSQILMVSLKCRQNFLSEANQLSLYMVL